MRKFLSTLGYLVITLVLVIIGIMGILGLTGDLAGMGIVADKLTWWGTVSVALLVGGFGGGIGMAVLTLANFFKQKTKSV